MLTEQAGTKPGEDIAKCLIQLGYYDLRVSLSRVAQEIEERTGKKVSRQRIYNILNMEAVPEKTMDWLAEGLGMTRGELLVGKRTTKPE